MLFSIFQILGIISISYNKKSRQFVESKSLKFYSYVIHSISLIFFCYIIFKWTQLTHTDKVSTTIDIMCILIMCFSIPVQLFLRVFQPNYILIGITNEILYLFNKFNIEKNDLILNSTIYLLCSFLIVPIILIYCNFQYISQYSNEQTINFVIIILFLLWSTFLVMPYYLALRILILILKKTNIKLKEINLNLKFKNYDEYLQIISELDEMLILYEQIYDIFLKLMSYFGSNLLIIIFEVTSNFLVTCPRLLSYFVYGIKYFNSEIEVIGFFIDILYFGHIFWIITHYSEQIEVEYRKAGSYVLEIHANNRRHNNSLSRTVRHYL